MPDIRDHIRQSLAGKARAADHKRSRAEAVNLKCLDCCAGQREQVKGCPVVTCFLWPYRPYASDEEKIRPAGAVPTVADYDTLTEGSGNPGAGDALRAWREERQAARAAGEDQP